MTKLSFEIVFPLECYQFVRKRLTPQQYPIQHKPFVAVLVVRNEGSDDFNGGSIEKINIESVSHGWTIGVANLVRIPSISAGKRVEIPLPETVSTIDGPVFFKIKKFSTQVDVTYSLNQYDSHLKQSEPLAKDQDDSGQVIAGAFVVPHIDVLQFGTTIAIGILSLLPFYNKKRVHSAIGYLTPNELEEMEKQNKDVSRFELDI